MPSSNLRDVDLLDDAPAIRIERDGVVAHADPAPTGLLLTSEGTRHFHQKNTSNYDFYRCAACHRIITRDRERAAYMSMRPGHVRICACGSKRYGPTWPAGIEWAKPSVVGYTGRCILAREVAPRLLRAPMLFRLVDWVLRLTAPVAD